MVSTCVQALALPLQYNPTENEAEVKLMELLFPTLFT